MLNNSSDHFIAFVWHSQKIGPEVMNLVRQTSARAIFDLSTMEPDQFAGQLKAAAASEAKISVEACMSSGLDDFLEKSGLHTLWVEYHPDLDGVPPELFFGRLAELEQNCRVIPIIGDVSLVPGLSRGERPRPVLALKGSEAGGFGSSESINLLYAAVGQSLGKQPHKTDLIIWGGVATPEAAAAFLGTGAKGIVCESLHGQTDLAAGEKQRNFLARLHPEHTAVVGSSLGVYCRVFDKGNAGAVKEANHYVGSLLDGAVTPEKRQALGRYLTTAMAGATAGEGSRQQLVPLGPEAAFSSWFVERFGRGTMAAFRGFTAEINRLLGEHARSRQTFVDSPAARALGTRYPFIQGAMTWISDKPAFARQVAEAGGLPTIALGLRTYEQLTEELSTLPRVMGGRPYAVNLIALPENPFLEDQLAWIRETAPAFVAVAAGPPAQAIRLRQEGMEVIYITADPGLMRLALEGGVRWLVLEGNEAGGHVGAHSSLMLAQMALEMKWRQPDLFRGAQIILAGGIYNRETAVRAAMLGANGLQMGTAYLATGEIVATGALQKLYQDMIVAASPGMTVVSGESIGFRVRSLGNAKMEAILGLEREYLAGHEEEASFRQRLEAESARSLLLAARGVKDPGGLPLDEETCRQQGQFMSGADAGLINGVVSIKELHGELAAGGLETGLLHHDSRPVQGRPPVSRGRAGGERVAVTGMALVNSLGNSPREVWQAALAMKSGIVQIPASKWDHSLIYDPIPRMPEKTYCQVGAFHNITISRKELGIPPQDFRTMSNSTRLTMYLAHQAVMEAGILAADIPRERIAVIISQNSGESANTLTDLVINLSAGKIVRSLRGLLPLTPDLELLAEKVIKSGNITVDDTTLLGRLNSAAGGFISNKYGFRGPCYSVSAACATSLVAIYNAIQMIQNGTIDAAIVGGGEENLTPAHFVEFSAIGALAGISGVPRRPEELSRPFDRGRDGFVLGEGGGMIVLERESAARKRGARIHAFIAGVGASNNDCGMVESVAATQRLALEASFAAIPYGPGEIDLVECHGTGTVQGDIEEVKALGSFFSDAKRTILAGFKSQIGHSLGASGLTSMIRGIKALQEGIFPGTLNYREPDPEIGLEEKGFYVPGEPLDWPRPEHGPRRLMVNAFGFGGANFVVHLEEALDEAAPVLVAVPEFSEPWEEPDADETGAGNKSASSGLGVAFFRADLGGSRCRLGVVAPDEHTAKKKIATLTPLKSPLSAKSRRALANQGIFAGREEDPPEPFALVFAGQGTFYPGMGRELYADFPLIREWMDRVAALADFDLLDRLFHAGEEELKRTLWQQPALFALEYGLVRLLLALGLQPAALAGHSMGELTALCVAGVFSFEDAFRIINKRAQLMDKAGALNRDPGAMIAVDVPLEILEAKVRAREQVYFTNFNSPRQIILGGATEEILALKAEIEQEGYWTVQLRVSMAFHSPIMKPICDEIAEFIRSVEMRPPQIPVISNTTQKPYPDDPGEIRQIILAHLENPVHWLQNVKTLWNDFGIRTFVEVGPKDTLGNLIADTIEGARCIRTSYPENESSSCRAALAQLFALGHLIPPQPPQLVDFPCLTVGPVAISKPPARESAGNSASAGATAVVQREIVAFILDTFGKFLKPTILAALRQEIDPAFSEAQLGELLQKMTGTGAGLGQPAGLLGMAEAQGAPTGPPGARDEPPGESEAAEGDHVEQLIRIIMETTGYERNEIEPHMDIRTDLAIRSSRLPIIMDAAERRFGIKVKLEDFIGLRTVQDLADRIVQVQARDKAQPPDEHNVAGPAGELATEAIVPKATEDVQPEFAELKRIIFQERPLAEAVSKSLEMARGAEVAVLAFDTGSELTLGVAEFWRQEKQAVPILLDLAGEYDLRTAAGAAQAVRRLQEAQDLAGLIILLDQGGESVMTGMAEVPPFLTGFFNILQGLLRLPSKRFCLAIQRELKPTGAMAVAAEGLVGMFLDAALEYDSVLCRSLTLDRETDLNQALNRALNPGNSLVQMRFHGQEAFGIAARQGAIAVNCVPDLSLKAGEVIVISGGGQGISPYLAYALAPFNPRLVLLGRSELDAGVDYARLQAAGLTSEEAIRGWVEAEKGDLPAEQLAAEVARIRAALNIRQSLEEISRLGMEATYYSCDVADQNRVQEVLDEVAARFGQIAGVIHGAGVLRDAFIELMSCEDFANVVAVKFLGAWNLYNAACHQGLRFFCMLSSVTAIQGNIGQINYCAANRAMSALAQVMRAQRPEIKVKALMLPPIEGVGMAADSELKALMKLRGWEGAYLHINELAALFCRELFLGPAGETWVMFVRNLPQVKTTHLELKSPKPQENCLTTAGVAFPKDELPMIQTVRQVDLNQGVLEADRTFSQEHDLWVLDHQPFKFLKNPFISGIMAVETFIEAAHLLYPHLRPLGIRRVEYKDIIECPPGIGREATIVCRRLETNGALGRELNCQVAISSPDITANGRVLDRWSTNYVGEVILGNGSSCLNLLPDFSVKLEELETSPLSHEEVTRFYKKYSNLQNRYRMIEKLDGAGLGVVRGEMVYRYQEDFADKNGTKYQYSPYLLEAIKHLVNCYLLLWDEEIYQAMIPYKIEEMRFSRQCRADELITLEGRLRSIDPDGNIWDAQAVDSGGEAIMQVRGLVLKPFAA